MTLVHKIIQIIPHMKPPFCARMTTVPYQTTTPPHRRRYKSSRASLIETTLRLLIIIDVFPVIPGGPLRTLKN